MSKKVLQFNGLGKSYIIGHKGNNDRYLALRDVISDKLRKTWSRIRHPEFYIHDNLEEFWALKDIDLEVNEGDRLGIIGRNGAGKTTLLKVLSRITEPTTGQIKIKGRVASLLEVGTGFHPELTGRENIYLNGAILGMTRSEIKRKFDEIVFFAGVEQFLDTPVKRFSSGMYVRLGFSVAAHLEPEILVIDEVLAVGDASFQKKCINKMGEVSKEGRTILFVSHQMQAVKNLCNRAILLDGGKKIEDGNTDEILNKYLNNSNKDSEIIPLFDRRDRSGSGEYKAAKIWFSNDNGEKASGLYPSKNGNIHALILPNETNKEIHAFVSLIVSHAGTRLFTLASAFKNEKIKLNGPTEVCWNIKNLPLIDSTYQCSINIQTESIGGYGQIDWIENASDLVVFDSDYWGTGRKQDPGIDKIFADFSISSSNH